MKVLAPQITSEGVLQFLTLARRYPSATVWRHCWRPCFHPGASTAAPLPKLEEHLISNRAVLMQMLNYVWPKNKRQLRIRVVVALGFLVASKLIGVSVPFLFKYAVEYYNSDKDSSRFFDTPFSTTVTIGTALLLGYGIARISSSLFNELRSAVFAKVAQNSIREIARTVFLHLHKMDLNYHLSRQTGGLAKAVDRGTRGLSFVLSALVFNVLPTTLEFGLVTTLMYYKSGGQYALLTLGCVATYSVFTILVTRWRTKFRHMMNEYDNAGGNLIMDSLINYETVKYFNNEEFEALQYDKTLREYEEASLRTSTSLAFLNFGQNVIFSVAIAGLMLMSAQEIIIGTMTVGDMVMLNGLLMQLSMPLNFLGSVYREVKQGMVDMQTMFTLLTLSPTIEDKREAKVLHLCPENAWIRFEDVYFYYLPTQPILRGFTLTIPAGKKDCVLFHNTILYNLQYGNINASLEQVIEAAKVADLHDAIMRMPLGYGTLVGERGLKLSGGEKQRVAIARTILKNPAIIIYDEATSSLDAITEKNIMESMKKAVSNRTSLFIAHRLATVVDADLIVVLENGKVAESGTHTELLSKPDSR
ncbi:ABC tran and ABC membrane domain containing prote in [Trichuris trichiura]|uniref:Iron-sulfur clusters transporter ABCB7, mitochondrial n=1 Tax=Trichuris trichiura TaxID=36087 RepID=A0A077ZH86_TRITR|nr:ABC tran and ABC membrane domain containing prote in [Trichuris trichiura]